MVKARQFWNNHIDCYYASALWRYQKEFAIKFWDHSLFVCQDDKHVVKVGEPGMPVAAVERGKSVLVATDVVYAVADHDFCKLSLTPSVTLQANIPESIDGSFYEGKVSISLKENCFEPSSNLRHLAEYNSHTNNNKPIECHYDDGGPDHNVCHMSNKLANIAYFLKRDLDFLCSIQTPPQNSWKNPVERIRSIVNIALCGTGVMHTECPTCEGILHNTSNMKQRQRQIQKSWMR